VAGARTERPMLRRLGWLTSRPPSKSVVTTATQNDGPSPIEIGKSVPASMLERKDEMVRGYEPAGR